MMILRLTAPVLLLLAVGCGRRAPGPRPAPQQPDNPAVHWVERVEASSSPGLQPYSVLGSCAVAYEALGEHALAVNCLERAEANARSQRHPGLVSRAMNGFAGPPPSSERAYALLYVACRWYAIGEGSRGDWAATRAWRLADASLKRNFGNTKSAMLANARDQGAWFLTYWGTGVGGTSQGRIAEAAELGWTDFVLANIDKCPLSSVRRFWWASDSAECCLGMGRRKMAARLLDLSAAALAAPGMPLQRRRFTARQMALETRLGRSAQAAEYRAALLAEAKGYLAEGTSAGDFGYRFTVSWGRRSLAAVEEYEAAVALVRDLEALLPPVAEADETTRGLHGQCAAGRAMVYALAGDRPAARTALDEATSLLLTGEPGATAKDTILPNVVLLVDGPDAALEWALENGVTVDNTLRESLAFTAARARRWDAARQLLAITPLDPDRRHVWENLAMEHFARGDTAAAVTTGKLGGAATKVRLSLARRSFGMGRHDEARALLDELFVANPQDVAVAINAVLFGRLADVQARVDSGTLILDWHGQLAIARAIHDRQRTAAAGDAVPQPQTAD